MAKIPRQTAAGGGHKSPPPPPPPGGTAVFTYLDTHPFASVQPTALGQNLLTLKPWNGKIWAGYGDYDTNTGPIAIVPFDPATGKFGTTPVITAQTEAIYIFRIINGKIYAPSTDPRGAVSTDYTVGSVSGGVETWTQVGPLVAGGLSHAFDMNTFTGTDLWICGSKDNNAVIYRSTDNGATWTLQQSIAPTSTDAARFYFMGVLNSKLYAESVNFDYTNERHSHVFNGTTWALGPELCLGFQGYHAEAFSGKLIFLGVQGYPLASPMLGYSGGTKSPASVVQINFFDYAIDGGTCYLLATNGSVYTTTDLITFTARGIGPPNAVSIAHSAGVCYLGTSDSKLYSSTFT